MIAKISLRLRKFLNPSENFTILAKISLCENFAILAKISLCENFARLAKFRYLAKFNVPSENTQFRYLTKFR